MWGPELNSRDTGSSGAMNGVLRFGRAGTAAGLVMAAVACAALAHANAPEASPTWLGPYDLLDGASSYGSEVFLRDSFFDLGAESLTELLAQRMRHTRRWGSSVHAMGLQSPEPEWGAYRELAEYDAGFGLKLAEAEARHAFQAEGNAGPWDSSLNMPEGLGIFLLGDTSLGQSQAAASSTDFWMHAISGGMDYRIAPGLLAGFAVSYVGGHADLGHDMLRSESMNFSLFASLGDGSPWFMDGSFNLGSLKFDGIRDAAGLGVNGTTARLRARSAGDHMWARVDTGYSFRMGALEAGPVAEARFVNARLDAVQETGPSALALSLPAREIAGTRLGLGAEGAYDVDLGRDKAVRLWGRATYQMGFGGDSGTLIDATLGEDHLPLVLEGTRRDRAFVRTRFGLTAQLGKDASADLSYRTDFGRDDIRSHAIAASITLRF